MARQTTSAQVANPLRGSGRARSLKAAASRPHRTTDAPCEAERLPRTRGRGVAPQGGRADQGRARARQRRARPAEHVRRVARRVEVDGQPVAKQQLAYVLLHKPAGVVTTAQRPAGPADRRRARRARARASSRSAGSTSTRPARCCSRTTARSRTARAPALRRREGLRGRDLEGAERRGAAGARRRRRARGRASRHPPASAGSAPARFELVLHEGRNRQVRRMCEAVGHRVRRLHRSVYAGLGVDGLAPGEWRELRADAEVEQLRRTGPASLLTKPIRSNIASSVGSDAFARLLGAAARAAAAARAGSARSSR